MCDMTSLCQNAIQISLHMTRLYPPMKFFRPKLGEQFNPEKHDDICPDVTLEITRVESPGITCSMTNYIPRKAKVATKARNT
jgi:hypothetical protein